ncbi:MAG: hypothetical protein ACPG8W_00530 [Candidatus Promineifilaceae bacterium]
MEPIVHGLEEEHDGEIDFVYVDREDPANAEIVGKYGIKAQPIFILLDADGNEVQIWFGVVTPEQFEDAFAGVTN